MGRQRNLLIFYFIAGTIFCQNLLVVGNGTSISVLSRITNQNHHYSVGASNKTAPRPPHIEVSRSFDQSQPHGVITVKQYLEASSIIFGLAKIANRDSVSLECLQQFKAIENGILRREVWAMKVLDSSGNKEPGFIWGQNFWLGSRQGCEAVQKPLDITLSNQFQRSMKEGLVNDVSTPFEMDYRVVYVKHNSPWQVEIKFMTERIIHIGLCLPKTCSSHEIRNITQQYVDQQHLFLEGDIYDLRPEVIYMKDLKVNESFFAKKSLKIVGAFVVFTVLMILCAGLLNLSATDDDKRANSHPTAVSAHSSKSADHHSGKVYEFIKCFDLASNCRKLFTMRETTSNSIPVINGLRSVSCIWIMLFHVMWYMYFTVDNKTFLISYGERVFFQYVSTAPILVDVFFTISGFLQTFNFMKNDRNLAIVRNNTLAQNTKLFSKMVFHRYLRLAPLYLLVTGIVEIFSAYVEDVSIFHIHDKYEKICSNHWWKNIILIQNWFEHNEMCLNWTWSLACEMQFFLLSSILLFTYAKYPKTVKAIVFGALAGNIAWSYIIGLRYQFQLSYDVVYHTATEVYINPLLRIMPYLLGSGTGWLMVDRKGHFEIDQTTEKRYWNMAILVFFACIYSTVKRDMSFFSTMSLLVVGRLSFSIAICWMIVGSATGRSTWWSRILESKLFQHINRLSYAIYLLNPFVIAFVFSLSNTSTHVDPLLLCVLTSGFIVIVYLTSIVFSLAFEMPYCNWSSKLLSEKQKTA